MIDEFIVICKLLAEGEEVGRGAGVDGVISIALPHFPN